MESSTSALARTLGHSGASDAQEMHPPSEDEWKSEASVPEIRNRAPKSKSLPTNKDRTQMVANILNISANGTITLLPYINNLMASGDLRSCYGGTR